MVVPLDWRSGYYAFWLGDDRLSPISGKGVAAMTTMGDLIGRPESLITHWSLNDQRGGFLVLIDLRDGILEYGPNYTPDEAAKRFWEAVSESRRRRG